ncbi:MAG: family 1 glycosylhydrolase [Spirochaetes bacterium]|nr:family 1 glycosylhydrolase [Spirochaetota bacterium]
MPAGFRIGTATSALQIEGGDTGNSWYRWSSRPGRVKDGSDCSVADDHWNRVPGDVRLMKGLNVNAYRMGLEWSRIEPKEGRFDSATLDHYRDEILRLKKAGIEPMVTLHHFSNPLWMEDSGGWADGSAVGRFERYTEAVVRHLGDLVSTWVTINEPNVYLLFGHVTGYWPPGETSIARYIRGARVMIRAHIAAYRKIHAVRIKMGLWDTMAGAAHHLRVFDPKRGTRAERLACFLQDRLFHEIFVTGMSEGRYIPPIGAGYPMGRGACQDFLGVNYYTREMVSFNILKPGQMFGDIATREGAPVNDVGWEIYPEGLYRFCQKYYRRFGMPIYITENGTADAGDSFRARYIYDHLLQVRRLIDDGVDVRGYYHWSLMDNFEWAEGYEPRFGLVAVDYKNQKRAVRKSGKFYAEICKRMGVTAPMIRKYLSTSRPK